MQLPRISTTLSVLRVHGLVRMKGLTCDTVAVFDVEFFKVDYVYSLAIFMLLIFWENTNWLIRNGFFLN